MGVRATINKLFLRLVLGAVGLVIVLGVLLAGNMDVERMKEGPRKSSAMKLDVRLENPVMDKALKQLRADGQIGDEADEARYLMQSSDGMVELTRSDFAQLNARYQSLEAERRATGG